MSGVNLSVGMRFFTRVNQLSLRKIEIPEDFKEFAIHELGDKQHATVKVYNRIYRCKLVHARTALYIAGEGILQLAKDFKLEDDDVLFFEYIGSADFKCVVCCGNTLMEKRMVLQLRNGAPVKFFVEAISHYGLEFPECMFLNVSSDLNKFFRVQTRHGSWSIKFNFGEDWSMLGGECWYSFYYAHDLRRQSLIQMDYHGSGDFTATVFKIQSRCEQPFNLNGKLFVKVEEGTDVFKCLCNGERPHRVFTPRRKIRYDEEDEVEVSNGEAAEDVMLYEPPVPANVLDYWTITTRNHMVPNFCTKTLPRMYFPMDKWKKHHLDTKAVAVISVPRGGDLKWEVQIRRYKTGNKTTRVALTEGWTKFATDCFFRIGETLKVHLLIPPVHEPNNNTVVYMSVDW